MVVADVRITALRRSRVPLTMALSNASPSRVRPSIVVTRMIESLTTMPESPTSAMRLRIVRSKPSAQWPRMAPTRPSGMIDMTTKGWVKLANTHARMM